MDRQLLAGTKVRQMMMLTEPTKTAKFLQRLRSWLARKIVARTGWSLPYSLGPVHPMLREAAALPADLTIVHNEAPFWVGCRLLERGRKIAADFEDWYSEDLLPEARRHRPLALLRRLEGTLLRQAACCTTTSRSMACALASTYGTAEPLVLPNCFALQPTPSSRPPRPPELVWFSQTIGPGRGLEEFLAHWGQLPPDCGRITLVGAMTEGFEARLLDQVPISARDRVKILPPVSPDALPALLAGYDVGLALEPREPRNKDLTISNKILQYLNAGLAVVATPTAGQKEVMQIAPEAGIVVDLHSGTLRSQLEELLADGSQLSRAQIAARCAAEQHYHWENYAPKLVALVNQATATSA
jgi:glycosyltransferase involved in cell wall biosynthesis